MGGQIKKFLEISFVTVHQPQSQCGGTWRQCSVNDPLLPPVPSNKRRSAIDFQSPNNLEVHRSFAHQPSPAVLTKQPAFIETIFLYTTVHRREKLCTYLRSHQNDQRTTTHQHHLSTGQHNALFKFITPVFESSLKDSLFLNTHHPSPITRSLFKSTRTSSLKHRPSQRCSTSNATPSASPYHS